MSRKIEEFVPTNPPKVGMYSCGPTVYHYPHIGNLRTYISNDILKRTLTLNGFDVLHVMNITDVGHLVGDSDSGEDKMEKGAKREGKTVWQIAEYYANDFWDSLEKLNIIKPNVICKATDYIKEMINLISALEQKGYTYRIDDGVYFDTSKMPDYGKLARLDLKGLKAGARIELVEGKKNNTDFALWKFSYPGGRSFDSARDDFVSRRQMEWDSPWGLGFPGWHIECSAMSLKKLGNAFENDNFYGERSRTIDIHSGGIDHIPVHHTNEIAQSEAATGKQFVKYWIHFAHLVVDDEKMSKSLGNFYTKNDIENRGFDLLDFRYLCLNIHYRATMNFTWEAVTSGRRALNKLYDKTAVLNDKYSEDTKLSKEAEEFLNRFTSAINSDLNTSEVLSALWSMLDSGVSENEKAFLVEKFDKVLGLDLLKGRSVIIPEELIKLALVRDQYRKLKDWAKSDDIRKQILDKAKNEYFIEDTTGGTVIKKK